MGCLPYPHLELPVRCSANHLRGGKECGEGIEADQSFHGEPGNGYGIRNGHSNLIYLQEASSIYW